MSDYHNTRKTGEEDERRVRKPSVVSQCTLVENRLYVRFKGQHASGDSPATQVDRMAGKGQTLVMLDRHFQVRQNTCCFKRLAVEE